MNKHFIKLRNLNGDNCHSLTYQSRDFVVFSVRCNVCKLKYGFKMPRVFAQIQIKNITFLAFLFKFVILYHVLYKTFHKIIKTKTCIPIVLNCTL